METLRGYFCRYMNSFPRRYNGQWDIFFPYMDVPRLIFYANLIINEKMSVNKASKIASIEGFRNQLSVPHFYIRIGDFMLITSQEKAKEVTYCFAILICSARRNVSLDLINARGSYIPRIWEVKCNVKGLIACTYNPHIHRWVRYYCWKERVNILVCL